MKVNIIILNYNGEELLKECIPSIVTAACKSSHKTRVTVLDNGSSDGSRLYVENNFPEVTFTQAEKNRFLVSYNEYIKNIDDDIVILLNNDMKAAENFIDPLVKEFADKSLFFAAPKLLYFDGSYNGGLTFFSMNFGKFDVLLDRKNKDKRSPTFSDANAAFDRKKFVELEGFDDIFLPGTWEETDLCFRGALKGYKGIYVPDSVVYHKEGVSFRKAFGRNGVMKIVSRNMHLFIWKNIRYMPYILQYVFFLPLWLLFYILRGRFYYVSGFFAALKFLSLTIGRRADERAKEYRFNDRYIIESLCNLTERR